MRLFLGPLLLHLGFMMAGLGVLRASGVIERVWSLQSIRALGLAYLVGIAGVLAAAILLLVIGVPFTLVTLVVLIVAFTALSGPFVVRDLRGVTRPGSRRLFADIPSRVRSLQVEQVALILTLALFLVLAVLGLYAVSNRPIGGGEYDAWNLWARKANLMVMGSHLPTLVFQSPKEGYIQSYYPLLLPLLEAAHMRAMGVLDDRSVHVVEWLLLVGWVFAGMYLVRRASRQALAAALLCGVAVLMVPTVLTAYADVPSALFASLAVLALGVWLEQGRRGDLVVAVFLCIGAANVKNEGAVGMAAALVAAAGALLFTRERKRLWELGGAGAAVLLLGVVPWRVWLSANGIHGDHSFGKSFDISFLSEHRSRVWPAIKAIVSQIQPGNLDPRLFVPIGLAIALSALFSRRRLRGVPAYYLTVGVLYFIGLLWGYWTSPFTGTLYDGQVYTTVERITVGLGLIGLVAVIHVGGSALAGLGRREPTERTSDPEQLLKAE
jgi:hypothetical protein